MTDIGPVDSMIVAFPGNEFRGEKILTPEEFESKKEQVLSL